METHWSIPRGVQLLRAHATMIRAAVLCTFSLAMCCLFAGCATLIPEQRISRIAEPAYSYTQDKPLSEALDFAKSSREAFEDLELATSRQKAFLNMSTFGVAAAGGAAVAYNKPIGLIKAIAIAVGTLAGAETVLASEIRRSILGEGIAALHCAENAALTAAAAPAVVQGAPAPDGNPSPMAQISRRLATPASPLAKRSAVNGARTTSSPAADAIRKYAFSMDANRTAALPRSSIRNTAADARLAEILYQAASTQEAVASSVSTAAETASVKAARELVITTNMVNRAVISKLHSVDPTSIDIMEKVKARNEETLASLQQALVAAKKDTIKTIAELEAVGKVKEDADVQSTDKPRTDESPPDDNEDDEATEPTKHPLPNAHTDASGEQAQANRREVATAKAQSVSNALDLYTEVVNQAKQCSSLGGGK